MALPSSYSRHRAIPILSSYTALSINATRHHIPATSPTNAPLLSLITSLCRYNSSNTATSNISSPVSASPSASSSSSQHKPTYHSPHPKTRSSSSMSSRTSSHHKQLHISSTRTQQAAARLQPRVQEDDETYNPPTHLSAPPTDVEPTPLTETIRDFLNPAEFYASLKHSGVDFYTGVPDSLLKDFCAYVQDHTSPTQHIITANEGSAIGLATGYHLATRKFPVVYMQNSGYGNAVNPLLSLADPKVYAIPMLLLIGWRGEPGKKDEPQHLVQGKAMSSMLTDMNIQFEVLPDYIEGAEESIESALHYMERRSAPYAFLVRRQTFTPYKLKNHQHPSHSTLVGTNELQMNREAAIQTIIQQLGQWDIVVSTTGFTSRELYEYRATTNDPSIQGHKRDFLCVGSMGHANTIALGIALNKPSRQTVVLDGDGACIMHMGNLTTIGQTSNIENYKHILINNGSHDSVGGQPTSGFNIDFLNIAANCGYKWVKRVQTADELKNAVNELRQVKGPAMLEVLVRKGARKNLGRPKTTPQQNKIDFMGFLDV